MFMKEENTPYICEYCNKSTKNVDEEYLIGYNHLECSLKNT